MFRGLVLAVAIVGLVAVGLVGGQQTAEAQQTASATRSLPSEVESGGTLTVTITVADYGGIGQLTEEFHSDFTFERSSPAVTPSGQTLTFNLVGDTSVSYTLTAPATTETISISGFSGTLEPAVGDGVTVGGPTSVTVSSPPAQQTASATRSLPSEVESGGTLTVRITVADYGGIGQLTEEFHSDFTFVESSPAVTPSGQTLTFNLVGDTSVSYTLTAPATTETISISGFSGTLEPAVGDGVTVGGPSSVTVSSPPAQPTASATRSFSPSEVEPDSRLVVTIRVADYGGIGQLTETFHSDFTFVESSPAVTPSGQTLTFNLVGDTSVSYTLTAPATTGRRSGFLGNLEPAEGDGVTVGGPSSVQVRRPSPPPPVPPVPANRDPVFSDGSSTTRSIDENSADGANVGARVRATDRDGDRLTYALSGTDASSFSIVSSTGQVTVGTGTMLDYETKASYTVTVRATDPDNASDTIAVTITVGNVDEDGRVTFWRDDQDATTAAIMVGDMLTALAEDPDGNVGDTPPITGEDNDMYPNITGATWQWSKSEDMNTWMDIQDATNTAYAVMAADDEYYLRAAAMYDDAEGIGKSASEVTMYKVGETEAGDGILATYDADDSGMIERSEAVKAVLDYLIRNQITRDQAIEVVTAYILEVAVP